MLIIIAFYRNTQLAVSWACGPTGPSGAAAKIPATTWLPGRENAWPATRENRPAWTGVCWYRATRATWTWCLAAYICRKTPIWTSTSRIRRRYPLRLAKKSSNPRRPVKSRKTVIDYKTLLFTNKIFTHDPRHKSFLNIIVTYQLKIMRRHTCINLFLFTCLKYLIYLFSFSHIMIRLLCLII